MKLEPSKTNCPFSMLTNKHHYLIEETIKTRKEFNNILEELINETREIVYEINKRKIYANNEYS